MITELRNVLHLYRGCDIECEKEMYELKAVFLDGKDEDENQELWVIAENEHLGEGTFCIEDCRPVLRKLSDMTSAEFREIFNEPMFTDSYCESRISEISESLFYLHSTIARIGHHEVIPMLFKKGFDLFGLIESDQVFDKEKFILEGVNNNDKK